MATRYYNLENEAKAYLKTCNDRGIVNQTSTKILNDYIIARKNNNQDASFLATNPIALNGLVLWLDASIGSSYSAGGNLWKDLVITNNGELVNEPTYNRSNSGFFQFVTDDFVRIPNSTTLDTQTPSVEVWIKTDMLNQNGFWFEKGTVNTQYSLFQEGSNIQWRQNIGGNIFTLSTTTATFINTSIWYQVVGTYVSGQRRLYINGNLVNSDAQTGVVSTNNGGMSIGVYGGFSGLRGYYYNGNLAICRVYNRALTPQEILQNYNAQRSRFGL